MIADDDRAMTEIGVAPVARAEVAESQTDMQLAS